MTDVLHERKLDAGRTEGVQAEIWGMGTAVPPSIGQAEAMGELEKFGCETEGQRAWLRRVVMRSGVERRGSVVLRGGLETVREFYGSPADTGVHGPSTAARMERYWAEAPGLAERAAREALGEAGVAPADVTHVITVTCTGFYAPGLDVELIERLGLSRDVRRLQVGFMGCYAAINALAAARDVVLAAEGHGPRAVVLVVSVELCTLHFAYGWNPERLVANALFADGAGACVVGAAETQSGDGREGALGGSRGGNRAGGWRLVRAASLLIQESREAMTWRIGDHGFEMTLSLEVPGLIGKHVRGWCEGWLAEEGLGLSDVRQWAIHPGGPRILSGAMEALGLGEADVEASRKILAEHGNMSSATMLFLLRELGRRGGSGPCVAMGFGPGLMAEGMLLERGP